MPILRKYSQSTLRPNPLLHCNSKPSLHSIFEANTYNTSTTQHHFHICNYKHVNIQQIHIHNIQSLSYNPQINIPNQFGDSQSYQRKLANITKNLPIPIQAHQRNKNTTTKNKPLQLTQFMTYLKYKNCTPPQPTKPNFQDQHTHHNNNHP